MLVFPAKFIKPKQIKLFKEYRARRHPKGVLGYNALQEHSIYIFIPYNLIHCLYALQCFF